MSKVSRCGLLAAAFLVLSGTAYAQFVPPLGMSTATRQGGPYGQRVFDPSNAATPDMREPNFRGSVTITGVTPQITFASVLGAFGSTIWNDVRYGLNFATNTVGKKFTFYTNLGTLRIQDVAGAAQLELKSSAQSVAAVIWQDIYGGLYLSPGSENGSVSIFSNGTGTVNLRGNHIHIVGNGTGGASDGSILDFFIPSDTSQTNPSSIFKDQYKNFYIAAQTAKAWLFLEAGDGGLVSVPSPLRNSAIPQSNPGTNSHYVCVDDAGDYFRSDSACQ